MSNTRTIVVPADTVSLSITFPDPAFTAMHERLAAAPAPQTSETVSDTTDRSDLATKVTFCANEDIIGAIQSDSRYTQRSLAAIQKYLNGIEPSAIKETIETMLDDEQLTTRINRSGVRLYALA